MNPWPIVRGILGMLTIAFAGLALVTKDVRWWAASTATGTMWWVWDLAVEHVLEPLEDWLVQMVSGAALSGSSKETRPTLEETIVFLERHLANPTARKVDINAALRLVEIYRTVKQDPAHAAAVLRTIRERYPDAPELARFERDRGDDASG